MSEEQWGSHRLNIAVFLVSMFAPDDKSRLQQRTRVLLPFLSHALQFFIPFSRSSDLAGALLA